ncbi:MAG TPA: metallophosphoesterase [Acidimicrobiales bacterium]|nr:metallophosphoesterase [Acidimicrobiales bacterium]
MSLGSAGGEVTVFAVEDTAAQLVWSGEGDIEVRVGDWAGWCTGPLSAVVVEGLTPDRTYEIRAASGGRVLASFRTLEPPPGELLCRFATVSDTHVGERAFGVFPRFREDPTRTGSEAYPARCLRAAVAEAAAWGAGALLAKGDLTWSGRPLQWQLVAEALATSPVPVHATLGNHDVVPRAIDGRDVLQRSGIVASRAVEPIDLPGIRVVIGHSADRGHRYGVVDGVQRDEIVRLVREAPGPAFFTTHHYVNPLPVRSRYPRGIERAEGDALLREVAAANPSTFVSFGHTHRHRRKRQHGLPTTEVGSTKDYPGVWAGYAVHEGGIRQVVRRVAEPSSIAWTERTAAVLGGFWGRWSPGRLSWRCFSWSWPR